MSKGQKSFLIWFAIIINILAVVLVYKNCGAWFGITLPKNYVEEIEASASKQKLADGYYSIDYFGEDFRFKKPNLGFVYISNGDVTKYGFYYDDYFEQSVNGDLTTTEYDAKKMHSVKDFGAVGDGVTDDSAAIKAACEFINSNGGILYFPTATYLTSVIQNKEAIINISSEHDVIVDLMGSKIVIAPNSYPRYYGVYANGCNSVVVRNGILVGDKLEHDYTDTGINAEYKSHAQGCGLTFYHSKSAVAYNIETCYFIGDGFYLGNNSQGVMTIDQCYTHNNRRMGITVGESDQVYLKNTVIHDIGDYDGVQGVDPKSGVDLEPETGTFAINKIEIEGLNIYNIGNYGIVGNKRGDGLITTLDATIRNCTIEKLALDNCKIMDSTLNYSVSTSILLANDYIKNTTINLNSKNGHIFLTGGNVDSSVIQSNNDGSVDTGRIFLEGATVTNSKFLNIRGNNTYQSCSNAGFGIVLFSNQGGFGEGSRNNYYENSTIYINGDVNLEYSKICKSHVYVINNTEFNALEIYDGTSQTHDYAIITMNECSIINSGTFSKSAKILNNCYMELEIAEDWAFGNNSSKASSRITNSQINIMGGCSRYAFDNLEKIQNSRINILFTTNKISFINRFIDDFNDYIKYG